MPSNFLKHISIGLIISIFVLFIFSFFNNIIFEEIFLYETVPHYNYDANWRISQIFNFDSNFGDTAVLSDEILKEFIITDIAEISETQAETSEIPSYTIIGLSTVIFEVGTEYEDIQSVIDTQIPQPYNLADLTDLDTLRSRMYTVNPCTMMTYADFNVGRFMSLDMRINPETTAQKQPQILIFHTHSTEGFADSDMSDFNNGIVGVGAYLAELLNEMGIVTMHLTERFDIVNGESQILGAYERQVPVIENILAMYPTIEIAIDLHRDGLPENSPKLVTEINGKPTAQIMFFNGLSQLNVNGVLTPIASLPNPNLPYNLAFSFQMQMAANEMHPGFTRRIFLRAYRYSLHFLPKSLLVEVGAQTNTFQEAINAMYPLAEILSNVIR